MGFDLAAPFWNHIVFSEDYIKTVLISAVAFTVVTYLTLFLFKTQEGSIEFNAEATKRKQVSGEVFFALTVVFRVVLGQAVATR